MAKKAQQRKSTKGSTRKKSTSGSSGPSVWARAFTAFSAVAGWLSVAARARAAWWFGAITIVGVGVIFGGAALRTAAAERLASTASAEMVRFEWPALDPVNPESGSWLPVSEQRTLSSIAAAATAGPPTPLHVAPLRELARELGDSGWFEKTPIVRRTADGVVEIDGDWRIPAAVVRQRDGDHLISWSGMPMPVRYDLGASSLPVIQGVSIGPAGESYQRFGRPWPGDGAKAGLAVLSSLADIGLLDHVAGVDVSLDANGGTDRRMIELVTPSGGRVVWGAPPDEFRPGEVETKRKLRRLADLYERYGAIDAGQSRIAIYGAEVVIDGRER